MHISKSIIHFTFLLGLMYLINPVFAQVEVNFIPTMINYQGYLTDQSGTPLTGTYQVTFTLYYDSTSTASIVWEETHDVINVANGLFNVFLGSIDTLTAADLAGERYLGIRVAGEPEMTPRMRIASTAYSLWAEEANNARTLSAVDGDPEDVVIVDTEGNVGVGVSTPTVKLDVDGVINATNSRPIRQQMVHRRIMYGFGGDTPKGYTNAWTYLRHVYGPFGYAIPAVQPGATRQYRIYAIYTDGMTTSGDNQIRFNMDNGQDVVFIVNRTWGTSGASRSRDWYSNWTTQASGGHGFIEIQTTVSGTAGTLFYLELQAWDFY
jgi:hypothetical protein